jgi:hypothetical protein
LIRIFLKMFHVKHFSGPPKLAKCVARGNHRLLKMFHVTHF